MGVLSASPAWGGERTPFLTFPLTGGRNPSGFLLRCPPLLPSLCAPSPNPLAPALSWVSDARPFPLLAARPASGAAICILIRPCPTACSLPTRSSKPTRTRATTFMMLSDHFIGHFNWPIADTRRRRSNNFTTIIGSELHAPETSAGELWHIVAAGLPLDFEPAAPKETGAALAQRAAKAGAFIGIAHPAWSQLTIEDGRAIDVAHAVEIYNHGCAVESDRGEGWYLLDQMLTEGRRLYCFATDDAHSRPTTTSAAGFR